MGMDFVPVVVMCCHVVIYFTFPCVNKLFSLELDLFLILAASLVGLKFRSIW